MIGVIGAGPAGSHVARLLANKGYDVALFEEHEKVGCPCQCTGIVTSSFTDIVKPRKEFVVNRIKRFRVYSPNRNFIELKMAHEELILDRPAFDQHMAQRAVDAGVTLFTSHKFVAATGNGTNKVIIKDLKNNKKKEYSFDYLIGADGPGSPVGRAYGLVGNREFYAGAQATVRFDLDADLIETYFGDNFPAFFGWITPEGGSRVRIGLATKKNPYLYFKKFLAMKQIREKDILERQGGVIPVYTHRVQTSRDKVFLVGDAALQIKATTGGGIISGLLGAEALAEAIHDGKNYDVLWRKRIGKNLLLHRLIRNILNKFSDTDYDYLTTLCNKTGVKTVIQDADREFPSSFLAKLLLTEPRFLYYASKLW